MLRNQCSRWMSSPSDFCTLRKSYLAVHTTWERHEHLVSCNLPDRRSWPKSFYSIWTNSLKETFGITILVDNDSEITLALSDILKIYSGFDSDPIHPKTLSCLQKWGKVWLQVSKKSLQHCTGEFSKHTLSNLKYLNTLFLWQSLYIVILSWSMFTASSTYYFNLKLWKSYWSYI